MSRRLAWVAVCVALTAAASSSAAIAARRTAATGPPPPPKGSLVVTFRGSGTGGYHFHTSQSGAGGGCRTAETTYAEAESYHWAYRFVVPPSGGSVDTPASALAAGQVSTSQQTLQCAGTAPLTSTCTQTLQAPPSASASDLTYPGVTVGTTGRLITVGAVGELVAGPPACGAGGALLPDPLQGFAQLQASVIFPRALLATSGDVTRRFTMAGAGLYAGLPLSGGCSSVACDVRNCVEDAPPAPAPSSCSFDAGYAGTIEVRVVR
jgi:hypothetical protein